MKKTEETRSTQTSKRVKESKRSSNAFGRFGALPSLEDQWTTDDVALVTDAFDRVRRSRGKRRLSVHDLFFYLMWRDRLFAIDFMRANFGDWEEFLDFDRLEIGPTVYVDRGLNKRVADLVYRIPIKGSDKTIAISIVLEHKAQSGGLTDKLTAAQLLSYLALETRALLEDSHDGDVLPAVPILIYSGPDVRFELPAWGELFPIAKELSVIPAETRFPCINLTRMFAEGKLVGSPLVRAIGSMLGCAGLRKLTELAAVLLTPLRELGKKDWTPRIERFVEAISRYFIFAIENVDQKYRDDLLNELLNGAVNPETEECMKNYFTRKEEAWVEKGVEKGEVKSAVTLAPVVVNGLVKKFGKQAERYVDDVYKISNFDMLTQALNLIFDSSTLDDFERNFRRLGNASL